MAARKCHDPHYTSEIYADGTFSLSIASAKAAGVAGVTTPAADQDRLIVVCLNARESATHLYERLGLDLPAAEAGVVQTEGVFTWVHASDGNLASRVLQPADGPAARIVATSINDLPYISDGVPDYAICYRLYEMVAIVCDAIVASSRHNRVVAHCALGVSRSVSFAVLFLMVYTQSSHEVLHRIRRKRACAAPNEYLMNWLYDQTAVVLLAKERGVDAALELVAEDHKKVVANALAAAERLRDSVSAGLAGMEIDS